MDQRWRILLIEDSAAEAVELVHILQASGNALDYERVATREALATALDSTAWEAILASDGVAGLDPSAVLAQLNDRQSDVPVIVISNDADEDRLVAWLKAGAVDYLRRDRLARLASAIERAQREVTAQHERRRIENNYRMLMEQTTDAISIADAQGHYREVNAAASDMLGYSRDELLSLAVTDLIAPDELQHNPVQIGALRDGQIVVSQRRLRRKDGQLIFVETSARMLTDGEILAITRDITSRKQAEEQLQRYSRELAQSNEELKRFAYIVSHDLRAPLVNLKGFASELRSAIEVVRGGVEALLPQLNAGLRSSVEQALTEDIPEALNFIDTSATRMDHFINALLKLSRLGRAELNLEPIDMQQLVNDTLKTLAHRIEERQVQVIIDTLPDVVADRTSMEQIMTNLLNNAVLYLEPSRPGRITITGERADEYMTFHVNDNGRGIASHDRDKVFAPFRRAGRQDVPGEGMGLAYVQTLVRRHGGQIWHDSELDVGTTFSFTIANYLTTGEHHG
jgi:PAS domain S-box-containing protein